MKPEYRTLWRQREKMVANFLKHADRDRSDVLEGFDIQTINEMTFGVCVLALSFHVSLPERLAIGFSYVGFRAAGWLDFEGLCDDLGMNCERFAEYAKMNDFRRRELMLQAYESSLNQEAMKIKSAPFSLSPTF